MNALTISSFRFIPPENVPTFELARSVRSVISRSCQIRASRIIVIDIHEFAIEFEVVVRGELDIKRTVLGTDPDDSPDLFRIFR